MACWWKYHGFMAFSNEEKQRVKDLTGRILLLLNPFMMHCDKTLEFLEPQIWMDEALESVHRDTFDFANAKKSELDDRTYVRSMWSFVDHSLLLIVGIMINMYP